MEAKKAKNAIKAIAEASEERRKLASTLKGKNFVVSDTRKLFREGNESKLMKLGVAFITFPDPTPITPIVGAGFVAAGAIQRGIKNRAMFAEDVGKDFKKALKELSRAKDQIRI